MFCFICAPDEKAHQLRNVKKIHITLFPNFYSIYPGEHLEVLLSVCFQTDKLLFDDIQFDIVRRLFLYAHVSLFDGVCHYMMILRRHLMIFYIKYHAS